MDAETLERIRLAAEAAEERAARARRIAELIRLAGGYRWVGIYEVTPAEIGNLAWSGPGEPAHPRFPVSQGLCGAAVRSRQTIVVDDVTKDPRYLTTFGSTRAELVVPVVLAGEGRVAGLIDVESERVNAFGDADRAFLEECAAVLPALWR